MSACASTSGLAVSTSVVRPERHGAAALAPPRLGVRVDGAGRLVQHQHLGVGEQHPGQREALPLAAGQAPAALARPAVSSPPASPSTTSVAPARRQRRAQRGVVVPAAGSRPSRSRR